MPQAQGAVAVAGVGVQAGQEGAEIGRGPKRWQNVGADMVCSACGLALVVKKRRAGEGRSVAEKSCTAAREERNACPREAEITLGLLYRLKEWAQAAGSGRCHFS